MFDKIIEGMRLMKEGCAEQPNDNNNCKKCPFDKICDVLAVVRFDNKYVDIPEGWEVD